MPIALITLIDENRVWCKARAGVEFSSCDRSLSICDHAVASRAALVVPNLRLDERFADNPQVVGAPHLRFYAGVPLRALNGQPVGTLCVADTEPRKFTTENLESLRDLAALIEEELTRHADPDLPELLRSSEERFGLLLSTSADGFFDHNYETGAIHYAPRWKRMLGYEPDELPDSHLTFINLLHPDDASIALRYAPSESPANNEAVRPYVHEFRLRHRAGHWVWIESRGVALLDPARGSIRRVLGFNADITRRRQLEAQMRMLDQAVNHIDEAISVINAEDDMAQAKILYVNPAFSRITGYAPEEVIGRNPMFLLGPCAEPEQITRARAAVQQARTFRAELVNYRKDGTPFDVDWVISPLRDHLGQVTHWVSVRRDITGRKLAEASVQASNAQLALARDAAQAANRAKSHFLANMSHEIRTPLNGILGMAEVLALGPLNAEQQESLDVIQRSGEALLVLFKGILDFVTVESGGMEVERFPLSLRDLAAGLVTQLEPKAKARDIALSYQLDPALPAFVLGDPTRLRQILLNLLDNALKFTESGSISLGIRRQGIGQVRFNVRDTGVGIPPERMHELFQLFSQGDSSPTRRHGGTGLGLAISQKLARLLGGEIHATSVPGAGSTFQFVLPMAPSSLTQPDDATQRLGAANPFPRHPLG